MEECRIAHLHVVDCLHLGLVKPFDTLSIFPKTKLDLVVPGDHISSKPVLLTFMPEAFVAACISPRVDTVAVLFIIFVLSAVLTPIIPDINSHAFHVIVEPLALVLAPIEP